MEQSLAKGQLKFNLMCLENPLTDCSVVIVAARSYRKGLVRFPKELNVFFLLPQN